ncbi:MAG: RNA-binding S4 domain-containing protein [Tannerella sp.]|jgi:23S rRNA pseudouridine2605 synthase|nr:RNA-binding S4 domain-containing protein [Tannerella sp.]
MGIEEKDGEQELHPKQSIPENQRENAGSQERNYERKPAYHATRDGNGYQTHEENRTAPGRRPRIKDSRSINYSESNRISYGNNRPPGENRGDGRFNYHQQPSGQEGRRPYQPPRPAYGSGEGRDYASYQSPRPASPYGGAGERREQSSYSPRPNMDRGGYQRQERPGGGNRYDTNRPQAPQGYRPSYEGNRPSYEGNRPSYGNRGGAERYPGKRPQQRTPDYNPNAKYSFQKQLKYKEALTDPNEPIRLNKFLANAGVCSRREADEFIQAGVVKVNGNVITELGTKISRLDTVLFHERPVQIESKLYILLNKPKNCVTTSDDPRERRTVLDLVKNACKERIYPVGRLDRNTTGVLLLTNDGDLASKLTHPSYKKKKIYHVWLDKEVTLEDMEKLATGLELEDGEIHADAISYASEEDKMQVGIEIHSGKNRVVRRMFESLGYHVVKLDRVYFAGLTKKNLPRGKWRYLTERDVNALRMGAFE